MGRTRMIKPSFFYDEKMAELCVEGRLLFAGLWTLADREGRLEDRPLLIKKDIFPYDNFNVDQILSNLFQLKMIVRYVVDGQKYIQIVNFTKHQKPHNTEKASKIPQIPQDYQLTKDSPLKDGECRAYIPRYLDTKILDTKKLENRELFRKESMRENPLSSQGCVEVQAEPSPQPASQVLFFNQKRQNLSDEDWWQALRQNPAYAHIDFDSENAKMDQWLELPKNRRRHKNRQFVLNWLHRIEKPLSAPASGPPKKDKWEKLLEKYGESEEEKSA